VDLVQPANDVVTAFPAQNGFCIRPVVHQGHALASLVSGERPSTKQLLNERPKTFGRQQTRVGAVSHDSPSRDWVHRRPVMMVGYSVSRGLFCAFGRSSDDEPLDDRNDTPNSLNRDCAFVILWH
jgi:hypothetical protein